MTRKIIAERDLRYIFHGEKKKIFVDYKGLCGWLGIRNKHFLPLWALSEFTWIDTGTNRNHKTKEFAQKKLSKHERRQTNGYRMRFIVNFNQRIAM